MMVRVIAVAIALGPAAVHAVAQCPDGTPLPCSSRPIARPAVIVPSPTDRARRFVVLPFRNLTRGAEQEWLIEGSTTMLSDALGRWQGVTVVPDERLYPALKRAGIVPGTVIEASRVRRIAEETGGWTAVTGEVIATGGHVRIAARAWDVPTDRELVRATGEVPSGGDVRVAYDSVSLRLLRSAGLDSVAPDLADATTRNLDAYRAYLRGLAHDRRNESKDAVTEYQAAVRADSGFALAWARLANAQASLDPTALFNNPMNPGAQSSARAVALSAKLPPRYRLLVRAIDAQFRAQFGDARRALESMLAADSGDVEALQELADLESADPILIPSGSSMRPRGSLNRAVAYAKRAVTLDPSRNSLFGLLARTYVQAGVPGATPVFGIEGEPTSVQDLMQSAAQPGHVRFYAPVLRADSIALVPAESLAAIPKDSLRAARQRARIAARAWAERWVSATTRESAPYQMLASLYSFDHDYPAALRAVATADSLGVQSPGWSAASRRLTYLAKGGGLDAAGRLADSLAAARFFADPNHALHNIDAAIWTFALLFLNGRFAQADALLDQIGSFLRVLNPQTTRIAAFRSLMGNSDPEDEPGITRAIRLRQFDEAITRIDELAALEHLGPWLPVLLPDLLRATDSLKSRAALLLTAAGRLAAAGRSTLAFELASNAVSNADSTLEPSAAAFSWYRTGAEALNAVRSRTQARFHPQDATVTAQRASFAWRVDDAAPFEWNRSETPPGRGEYLWEIVLEAGGRYYRLSTAPPTRWPGDQPRTGSLGDLLGPTAARVVLTGALGPNSVQSDTTFLQGVIVQTEVASGVLRMNVTEPNVLAWIRREKPQRARFRFFPCAQPVGGARQCVDEQVTISYPE